MSVGMNGNFSNREVYQTIMVKHYAENFKKISVKI